MSDIDIIQALKEGKNDAYKNLYAAYFTLLCTYAQKLVSDNFAARSIVNDVIFSIWKNRSQLDIQDLRSYLLRAVRNKCLNFIAQEKRRNTLYLPKEEDQDLFKEVSLNWSDTPIDQLLAKELDIKIRQAIDKLPEQTRQIFLLSRSADLKYHEIAQMLDISIDVVKYHIKQALLRLRKELHEYFFKKK